MRPLLKQFADLTPSDFSNHPVWAHCHVLDYDEPWYGETDEETFRPWLGPLPVEPEHTIYLIRATVILKDGSKHDGFLTPAAVDGDFATMQPHVFVGVRSYGFWAGVLPLSPQGRQHFYSALGKIPDQVFPASFSGDAGLASGFTVGEVQGFPSRPKGVVQWER